MSIYLFNQEKKVIGSTVEEATRTFLNYYGYTPVSSVSLNGKTFDQEIINDINKTMNKPVMTGFLNYKGFTCYIDSVLLPLILIPGYFQENMLYSKQKDVCLQKIQNILISLKNSLELNRQTSCTPLLGVLKECNFDQNLLQGHNDPSEFLLKLMELFNLEPTKVKSVKKQSNNKFDWKVVKSEISNQSILNVFAKDKNILDTFQESNIEKRGPTFTLEKDCIIDSECLIFNIEGEKISFSPYITSRKMNAVYTLINIVNYSDNHYTSFFKSSNEWFRYDDLNPNLEIKNYQEVVDESNSNAKLLVYYKN